MKHKEIQLNLRFDEDLDQYIATHYPKAGQYRVLSRSLDARRAPQGRVPKYNYRIQFAPFNEQKAQFPKIQKQTDIPVIIGAGPAGLFCALRLKEYGIKCKLFERGDQVNERMKKISKYWRYGEMDEESNVCFGEGGAGLFSDGKLLTRVKSPLISYVLEKFVEVGADPAILYESNPHLGSNKIRSLIAKLSDEIKAAGSEIFYNTKVEDLIYQDHHVTGVKLAEAEIKSQNVVLAIGHSAKQFYQNLIAHQVQTQSKDFAIGVRVEHPRTYIDSIQFGEFAGDERLGTARYRISFHDHEVDRGTYSFCMCPGGYVLSSGTDADGLVTNGMSNHAHNSPWSNAAIVVSVRSEKDFATNPQAGLDFIQSVERKAFAASKEMATGREMPAMTMEEFMQNKLNDRELPKSSCPSRLFKYNIREILPDFVVQQLELGIKEMDEKMPGFYYKDALMIAPETRTSSPLTIVRDKETLQSISHQGLYPCGEGAGYAGGITSAAVDGVKVADEIAKRYGLTNGNAADQ